MIMKNTLLASAALLMLAVAPMAHAAVTTYNVTETFLEPDTAPRNTIFTGSFSFDDVTKTVSSLEGYLTESMTGTASGVAPYFDMTQLHLTHQLSAVYDASLGGLLVTTFLLPTTNTFSTAFGGDGWAPGSGFAIYSGFPSTPNPGNAYARIFVNTTDPMAALTQAQINKLAYADCAPGGMMSATCMTGTTVAGYGVIGSMSGYPVSQVITSAVPEPEAGYLALMGLSLMGLLVRQRRPAA
jgi:hypothetical protein